MTIPVAQWTSTNQRLHFPSQGCRRVIHTYLVKLVIPHHHHFAGHLTPICICFNSHSCVPLSGCNPVALGYRGFTLLRFYTPS